MTEYQKYITIEDPNCLVLSDLPFVPGQRVKLILTIEDEQQSTSSETLKTLFKTTQALPQVQAISNDEIAAEIAAYRFRQ